MAVLILLMIILSIYVIYSIIYTYIKINIYHENKTS